MRAAFHVFLPLLVGGMLYLCWRPQDILLFEWVAVLGMSDIVLSLRHIAGPTPDWAPASFIGSAPAALWQYSLSAALLLVWRRRLTRESVGWIALGLVVAWLAEIGQSIGCVPGAFDLGDLIFPLLAAGLAVVACTQANEVPAS